tara:strand:- start:8921 stop:10309 length:1389 start_codon:yes stop_codon:yes gene_type:complete
MALNPFFLQGSKGEQRLLQDLANETIQIHGIEFIYMPRIFVNTKTVLREVTTSKFDKSFPLEGYIQSYEGFDSGYNLLTKFGVRSTASMDVLISQERYSEYITPLLSGVTGLSKDPTRPLEGDLIYFPLRDILFEIKYVDDVHEFYQLQKNYTYKLTLEPFEYGEEEINTGLDEVDDDFKTAGYNVTMTLVAAGATATAFTSLASGAIHKIDIISGGTGYTNAPQIQISAPLSGGVTAEAVAITTTSGTSQFKTLSVSEVIITKPGFGYTSQPTIQFIPADGKGSGTTAIAGIATSGSVGIVTLSSSGSQYSVNPPVTFTAAPAGGVTAIGTAFINTTTKQVSRIEISNSGFGYTVAPTITIGAASTIGFGTYQYGEIITGQSSLTTAFVTDWDKPNGILLARNLSDKFAVGETITNSNGAAYVLNNINYDDDDVVNTGDEIQTFSDSSILDFTERNPFGEV